ncbi:unnamed protein product [Bursaphelenchus okinawaensis]|uniref:Uncharacterized protein n=1 Tax=Bursaphelenchus okinawaensis TaxID=465554 RepID=A0A811JRN4_9BILA|nr:unnamed protein product [Bursaphelenchus okinawaensis]CAG9079944.1 unnamed protein product [Bursaphelenchus okinawaensis]
MMSLVTSLALPLALFLGLCSAAPAPHLSSTFGGEMSGAAEMSKNSFNASVQSNFFEATLILVFPDTLVNLYKKNPRIRANNFKALKDPQSQDQVKALIQQQCPEGADKVTAFFDQAATILQQVPDSVKSLFEKFFDSVKSFQTQIQTSQNASQPPTQDSINQVKDAFTTLVTGIRDLSDTDKNATAQVFPKLSAFITGDDAKNFQTSLANLMAQSPSGTTGKPDPAQLAQMKTAYQTLRTDFKKVINDYTTQNQQYLTEASQLVGNDLASKLKSGKGLGGYVNNNLPADLDSSESLEGNFQNFKSVGCNNPFGHSLEAQSSVNQNGFGGNLNIN